MPMTTRMPPNIPTPRNKKRRNVTYPAALPHTDDAPLTIAGAVGSSGPSKCSEGLLDAPAAAIADETSVLGPGHPHARRARPHFAPIDRHFSGYSSRPPRRRVYDTRPRHRRPADLGQGGADDLGPIGEGNGGRR